MNKDELFKILAHNETQLKRIFAYLSEKNIDSNDPQILGVMPDGYETVKYKAWGLRHANIELDKGGKTFDDVDVKAVTGLDSVQDALDVLGVQETDALTEDWIKGCVFELNQNIKTYIAGLSSYLSTKLSLTESEINNIKSKDPIIKNSEEMENVRSIFGR